MSKPLPSLTLAAVGTITASATSRTLSGVILRYGEIGRTSKGPLRVRPGALQFPDDLGRVKLTFEHERDKSRGHLTAVEHFADHVRASFKVADGPEGDAALREAADRTRDGLSFDAVDVVLEGDEIVSGRVVAVGQVGIPAYADGRIDQIAAASTPQEGNTMLTDEQRARLEELIAKDAASLTDEERKELDGIVAILSTTLAVEAPAPEAAPVTAAAAPAKPSTEVAASMSAIPSGGPHPSGAAPARTQPVKGQAFAQFVGELTSAMQTKSVTKVGEVVTAALQDITHSAHTGNIEQPAWSGELWSGLLYEPVWSDLFAQGTLTNWSGIGWRFTSKLAIQDYAGNKAEIPSDNVTTETSTYTAARAAVGVDVDRKFYDFPNEGFVEALWQQVRESWAILLDGKVRAYALANATTALQADGVTPVAAQPTLLKAAAVAARALKRRRVGRATGIVVNEDDYFTLLDVAEKELPVFLDLFGIDPRNFRPDDQVPAGTVIGHAQQAATVRTRPGSPVRVTAQHLANGGIDDAFFGYWAVEEHHTNGIAKSTFTPA
jgi:hypothetical protein